MAESADVAITTVTFLLVIVSIVGNSLVCAVIKRDRDMRIPINYLIVNLAVADLMYATFLVPVLIMSHTSSHPEGVTGKILCTLLTGRNLAWIGTGSSVVTLVAIAVERYYAVIYPLGNKGKFTMHKLKVTIFGSWVFSFMLNFPQFIYKEFDKEIDGKFCIKVRPDWAAKAYLCTWLSFVLISFTLMIGSYSRVVYTLWFKRNDINELTYQQQGALQLRKRVTLMAVIISTIFGVCWPPDLILHVVDNSLSPVVFSVTHTMIMFNSAVNPFAYALINQRFRERIKKMICCRSSSVHRWFMLQGNHRISRWQTTRLSRLALENQLLQSDASEKNS